MFVPGQNQLLANLSLLLFLRIFRSFVFMILKRTFEECVSLFSYQRSVLHCRLSQTALLLYHVVSCLSRTFFNFFSEVVLCFRLISSNFYIISQLTLYCQELFSFLWFNRFRQLQLWYNSIYFCFRQLSFYIFLHFLLYVSYITFSVPENELHLWCSPPESARFLFPVPHFSCMLPEGLLW